MFCRTVLLLIEMKIVLEKKSTDIFTKAKRSDIMSRIRSRGNKATEMLLASLFRQHGITGWRRHLEIKIVKSGKQESGKRTLRSGSGAARRALGKQSRLNSKTRPFRVRPDFVFSKLKLAVFVDGCFWHGCPKHATRPKNHRPFWDAKFATNKRRDTLVTRTLRAAGWQVWRIWECQLKG